MSADPNDFQSTKVVEFAKQTETKAMYIELESPRLKDLVRLMNLAASEGYRLSKLIVGQSYAAVMELTPRIEMIAETQNANTD